MLTRSTSIAWSDASYDVRESPLGALEVDQAAARRTSVTAAEISDHGPGAGPPSRHQRNPSMTPLIGFSAYTGCQAAGTALVG